MEYRYLGKSGLQVSALSLGAWVTYGGQVGEEIAYECMSTAYEAGVNFFDTAEAYGGGQLMGTFLLSPLLTKFITKLSGGWEVA